MKIGLKSGAGLAFAIVVVLVLSVSFYITTQHLLDANARVAHSYKTRESLERVLSVLANAETGQRGFILMGEDRYLQPYDNATAEVASDLDAVTDLTSDDPDQQQDLQRVRELTQDRLDDLRKTIYLRRTQGPEAALRVIATGRDKQVMDELRSVIGRMQGREQALLESRSTAATASGRQALLTVSLWMPVSLLILTIAAIVMMRRVRLTRPAAMPAEPQKKWASPLWGYALAIVVVVGATVLRWWLETSFGNLSASFLTYYPAVLFVATLAGGGPGLLATLLSAAIVDYWFMPPYGSFAVEGTGQMISLGVFTATGMLLSVLAERLRQTRWAEAFGLAKEQEAAALAEKNERLAEQAEELAHQSEELAAQNEELTQQNEHIAQQSEELAQQNEETQAQSEEIHALNAELSQREGMLQKLLDSARHSSPDESVIQDICAAGAALFGDSADAVVVYEQQGDKLLLQAQAGVEGLEKLASRPLAGSFAALVMQENRTACLNDTSLRPDMGILEVPGRPRFEAVLCAPMLLDGKPAGAMAIYSRHKQQWTAEQFRLAEWLAVQCGHILDALRLQRSLRDSEQRNRSLADLLDRSDQPFGVSYPDGTLGYINGAFERLTGYTAAELRAIDWTTALTPPEWRASEQAKLEELARSGQPVRYEKEYIRKDGSRVPIELLVHVVRDEQGRPQQYYSFLTDLTHRKQAEAALARTAEELQRSNHDLQQFAYIASHDLQEPLRTVASFVSLLKDRYSAQLDDKARQYIAFAVDGATRMSQLVSDLLAYSRVDRQNKDFKPVDSERALAAAVANLRGSIEETGVAVTHDALPKVAGDMTQLAQVFQNLIGNAVKFRKPDEPCRVHVGAERRDGRWQFSVRDNGIGIAADQHERVFVIFHRLHTREKYPGTGIGLAICKKIVERHGGSIWLESTAGAGSTFFFTLPAAGGNQP